MEMTQKRQSKKFCIKTIKGNQYVYSWSYRPKHLRTKRKNHRYSWEYIGNYTSKSAQKMLKRLPLQIQESLRISYKNKVRQFEIKQELMKSLGRKEPFKSERERISRINNRDNYSKEMILYERHLHKVITEHLSEQQSTL